MKSAFAVGALAPETVGRRVLQAIRDNEFYILTHTNERETIMRRTARLAAAFDRAEAVMPTLS